MTDLYNMPMKMYHTIWRELDQIKSADYSHFIVDRWLSIKYGIVALNDEAADDHHYSFKIRDSEKFTLFLLRWS